MQEIESYFIAGATVSDGGRKLEMTLPGRVEIILQDEGQQISGATLNGTQMEVIKPDMFQMWTGMRLRGIADGHSVEVWANYIGGTFDVREFKFTKLPQSQQ